MTELQRIEMIARLLGASGPPGRGVERGIGDDAAVLGPPGGKLVWTIDQQVEGVHFRRGWLPWRDVGWRSFMAAASDVAAMGAVPWCALSALVLPDDVDDAVLGEIVRGQGEASRAAGAPIVGGNLARGPSLSIATTLLGTCGDAVERSGARAGDGLWLAGRAGLAAAGWRALERGVFDDRVSSAIAAWRTPVALLAEGRAMATVAHAAIDVSDGLARDCGHVADASGVCLVLEEAALLSDGLLLGAAAALRIDPLDLALHGGEDYALVVASERPIEGFRRIGSVREGRGLVLRGAAGERALQPDGFDHWG